MLYVHINHPRAGQERLHRPDRLFLTSGNQLEVPADERDTNPFRQSDTPRSIHPFTVLEAETPCVIRFTDETGEDTAVLGPFDDLRIVDGTIWYGGERGRPLAQFDDQSQAWLVYPSRARYRAAVLAPAKDK